VISAAVQRRGFELGLIDVALIHRNAKRIISKNGFKSRFRIAF
jgi:hypothetical protein